MINGAFLFLAALAAKEYNSSHVSRNQNKSAKKSKSSSSYNSGPYTYKLRDSLYQSKYGYSSDSKLNDALHALIQHNPKIAATIERYSKYMEMAMDKKQREVDNTINSYCEPSAKVLRAFNDAFANISDIGFKPELSKGFRNEHFITVTQSKHSANASYIYTPKHLTLDGVILSKKDFDAGINPFEATLAEYVRRHPDYHEQYKDLMSKVSSLEKRKLTLLVSSGKKEELAELQTKFAKVKEIYDQIGTYTTQAEAYKKLSADKKAKLAAFFEAQEGLQALSDVVSLEKAKSEELGRASKPDHIQDLIAECKEAVAKTLTPEQINIILEAPEEIAAIACMLTDEQFTDLSKNSPSYGYYYGAYNAKKDICDEIVEKAREIAKAQYKTAIDSVEKQNQPN